jgi:hypothetical protein
LSEIEIAFSKHIDVKQAVVIVHENNLKAFIQLHSDYTLLHKNVQQSKIKSLKNFLGESLPKYMIPEVVMFVNTFPTTANGKLDKLALMTVVSPTSFGDDVDDDLKDDCNEHNDVAIHPSELILAQRLSGAIVEDQKAITMLQFISTLIYKSTNIKPQPSSSFAMIGIDSIGAVTFKNFLSKSLGGISVNQSLIFDPDTTIESFAVHIYETVLKKDPKLLTKLNIAKAIENFEESDVENGIQKVIKPVKKDAHSLFNHAMLLNKGFIDGVRGFVMILVFVDHNFYTNYKLLADTSLFLILTGFTTALQEYSMMNAQEDNQQLNNNTDTKNNADATSLKNEVVISTTEKNFFKSILSSPSNTWDAKKFLISRFFALFPIYWLMMILSAGRVIHNRKNVKLDNNQYNALMIEYVFGMQTWSRHADEEDFFRDMYYVSLIWNVFIVYAMFKTVYHHQSLSLYLKAFLHCCIVGFLFGMYVYHPNGGYHAPLGYVYFTLGIVAGVAFYRSVVYFATTLSTKKVFIDNDQELTSKQNNASAAYDTNLRNKYTLVLKNIFFMYFPDICMTLLMLIVFLQQIPPVGILMKLIIIPILFAMFLISRFLQQSRSKQSLLSRILYENWFMKIIGECSLCIYISQTIVISYWYRSMFLHIKYNEAVGPLDHHQSLQHYSLLQTIFYYKLPGVIIDILFSILIHKLYQDRLIGAVYYCVMQKVTIKTNKESVDLNLT